MYMQVAGVITLLWAGMVLGISFLESWVKFRAKSLTKQVGLDVGRTVFAFFHRIQNVILLCLIVLSVVIYTPVVIRFILGGIAFIVFFQFFFLLPKLNQRVDAFIEGKTLPPSPVHMLYGIIEIFKFVLLIALGISCFSI